jgi:hypothetical protein
LVGEPNAMEWIRTHIVAVIAVTAVVLALILAVLVMRSVPTSLCSRTSQTHEWCDD